MADQLGEPEFKLGPYAPPVPERRRLGLLGILFFTPAAIVAAGFVIKEFKSRPPTSDQ